MAITKASVLKKILETAEPELRRIEFIPAELEVANLSTLFTNKTRRESAELMEMAWEIAEVEALSKGFNQVTLGKATRYGYSKGAMIFVGTRFESQEEMVERCDREAEWKATELRREANAKARQNKKDREELARLQKKLGVKS